MLHEKYLNETRNERGEVTGLTYNVPDDFNFSYDVVDRIAAENPGKTALMWCNEAGEERRVTFAEVKEKSDAVAAYLLSAGLRRGDKMMLILKRHYEFWYVVTALHKIGVIGIPATNQLLEKDIEYRFNAAGVEGIFCTAEGGISDCVDRVAAKYPRLRHKILVRGKKDGWVSFEDAVASAPAFVKPGPADLPKPEDIMLLYFTSGTSGMPKMVALDYSYPIGHIQTAKYWHCVDPDGLHLTISETGWAKSVWGKLYGQWFMEAGVFVYDYDRFNADTLLSCFAKYRITTFCAPPTMYRIFIKEDLSKYDLSSLKHATIAGEALNPEVFEQFYKATGLKLREGYGQTEMTLSVATLHWMEPRPGSMGKPTPAYNMDVVDENGKTCPAGVVGEIVLKMGERKLTGLFSGYYMDEDRTRQVWHDGVYHTGDTAWKDEDGFIWYVGRADDLIKSSGYRISPFEVESVVMEHPKVLECAVTGVPDPVRGQLIKATIVLTRGTEPTEELKAEIQNYVKTHTAPYKYPRVIEFVTELPKTISGKIRRVEIREQDQKN